MREALKRKKKIRGKKEERREARERGRKKNRKYFFNEGRERSLINFFSLASCYIAQLFMAMHCNKKLKTFSYDPTITT